MYFHQSFLVHVSPMRKFARRLVHGKRNEIKIRNKVES